MERLTRAGFEAAGESEAHVKMTKVIHDEGYVVTLKVLVPRAAEGEELAVSSLRAVLEQAMMERSEFDGLADAGELSSLDLRLTPELRARLEAMPSTEGDASG